MFAPRSTQIPTIILPPPNSTQVQAHISSAPIQTETIPIMTTTQSENLVYLDASDSEATISNPLQTKVSIPLPNQTDSGDTLSNVSSIKTAEFTFSDPPPDPETPPTRSLPGSQNTPTSNPLTSENTGSEVPKTSTSSDLSLAIVPYTHSLETAPPSHLPDLLDGITKFTSAAHKRASDLMESSSSNPSLAMAEWKLYNAWFASECDLLKIIAENQAEVCVQSLRKAWLAKQKEAEEREQAVWLKYQEEVLEHEQKLNEIAAKAEADAAAQKLEAEKAERLRVEQEMLKVQENAKAQADNEAQALKLSTSEAQAQGTSSSDPVAQAMARQAMARIDVVEQKIDLFTEDQKAIKDLLQKLLQKP